MNLTTITFDADSYQLVPKTATDEMYLAGAELEGSEYVSVRKVYKAMLAAAPQPETLSPFSPYLKDGESPIERLERELRDHDNTLLSLADVMAQRDELLKGIDKALTMYVTGQPMQFVEDKLAEVYHKIEAAVGATAEKAK